MKTLILTFCITALFFMNTKAQINYHVSGTIDRTDIAKVYLYNGKIDFDSTVVSNGTFEFKGTYKSPVVAMIRIRKPHVSTKIVLDNSDYKVTIDKNVKISIETASINHNLWRNDYSTAEMKANAVAKDSLLADYDLQLEKGKYNLGEQYLTKYQNIKLRLLDYYKKLVSDHPDVYIIPYMLKEKDILTQENFGSTFEKLSPEVRNNEWGIQLKALLEKKTNQFPDPNIFSFKMRGSKASYFDTRKVDGKVFNFSTLKGKWVLLDFWASWCAPCRAELPSLLKAYDQFKDKNFVIASVSVDIKTDAWQKALIEDKTPPFIHSNIAEFGNSDGFKYYQVNSIPSNFLINPDGIIVALNLRGDVLSTTLAKFIK